VRSPANRGSGVAAFEAAVWNPHLVLETVAEAAAAAVEAVTRFRTLMADQQPAEAGDDWAR
jgi:hypothetical protein